MNILLVHLEEITNNRVTVTGDKLKHLRKILKVQVGDHVKLGIIGKEIGTGTVEAISKEQARLHVHTDQAPPQRLPVHLILAVPRPIMLKRVLAQAASMGIEKISLLRSKRVEKSFLDSSLIENEGYTPFLLKGIEQAVDTRLPEVLLYRRFNPFIELLASQETDRQKLIAHPHGREGLQELLQNPEKKTTVAIGPEGGWIDYEVAQFVEIGFRPFTMGERILRVDTAVPAVLAQLALLQSHLKTV
jgi:RsmE family RNA methyltransferase